MNFKMSGKIAKDEQYITSSDDIRLDRNGRGKWHIVGFAHNPDGQDIKVGKMVQGADHYGHKTGDAVSVKLIDMPQFWSMEEWDTIDEARHDISEGVPLNRKWGFSAAHFGRHVPITFRFLATESLGDCILYDLRALGFSW